jgi:alcohol oxidase
MGGLLGGGSSINFMMYTRAQGVDFDSWDTDGWRAEDMIPLCNKLETYHPKGANTDQSKHGHVSHEEGSFPVIKQLLITICSGRSNPY